MRIKPDPIVDRQRRRRRELQRLFRHCPHQIFQNGLEIGAGDGYQSDLLATYVQKLICTEYAWTNQPSQKKSDETDRIIYRQLDAQEVAQHFPEKKFDLIFSSSVLEHLPRRHDFLEGAETILKDNGIAIHVIPNRFWKLCQMSLHHLNGLILVLERLFFNNRNQQSPTQQIKDNHQQAKKYSRLRRIVWPIPHGADRNNWQEYLQLGRKPWCRLFRRHGFKVVRVLKGPVTSGYSFGLRRTERFLEGLGLSSTNIYITVKKDHFSPYTKYFRNQS